MTDLNAPGGGSDDYVKQPKGNLDLTGRYFIWTSNTGGNRLDAFVVKIPSQVLMGGTPDTAPPLISAVLASGITTSGATIAWTTDEPADSQVEFGTTLAYGTSRALDARMLTGHSQALSGTPAGMICYFRVKSNEAAGNTPGSAHSTF